MSITKKFCMSLRIFVSRFFCPTNFLRSHIFNELWSIDYPHPLPSRIFGHDDCQWGNNLPLNAEISYAGGESQLDGKEEYHPSIITMNIQAIEATHYTSEENDFLAKNNTPSSGCINTNIQLIKDQWKSDIRVLSVNIDSKLTINKTVESSIEFKPQLRLSKDLFILKSKCQNSHVVLIFDTLHTEMDGNSDKSVGGNWCWVTVHRKQMLS